jgi:mycothiol S-conjugate amidase
MAPKLCIMTVHAHPDDEASKGAGTIARYHAQGVHTVLVTCTGGEEGDILNPAMDLPEVRQNLPEVRRRELEKSARIIGYDEVVMLGYRDSGMPDSPANSDARSFAEAPLDEAVERLVAVIRRTRPQVIVSYPKDQSGYPHPDHLRVNEISELAFDIAADPDSLPEAGPPWQPLRLCYVRWSFKRMRATHEKFLELGMESPYNEEWMARLLLDNEDGQPAEPGVESSAPLVVVDISGYASVTRDSLLAHATQVDPESRHWFGLPPETADTLFPYDEYEVAGDITGTSAPSDDLFAGIGVVTAR